MQEEGASHSAGRSEMDEENLNGAGIDEAEIEESEGSVQESKIASRRPRR
jgi:hypothetical protein